MSINVIQEYKYVHDNEILSYEVDVRNETLRLFTKYEDNEETVITFSGWLTHRLEDVGHCNIISDISRLSVDSFIDNNKEMLEEMIRYLPLDVRGTEDFRKYLQNKEQKVFEITSVVGLSGFVIAKEILIDVKKINE